MSHETNALTRVGAIRQYPIDLALISLAAILAYGLVTSLQEGNVLRLLVTLPFALFLPGYALVSVLFPASARHDRDRTSMTSTVESMARGIDVIERLGLSFGLSLAIVPLVGIVLPFTQWGFTAGPTAATLGIVTVVLAQLGVVRRLRLPQSERFTVSPIASLSEYRHEQGTAATVTSAILLLAVGTAVGALLLGVLAPASTGGYTELGLYGEDEDGDLVAGEIDDEIAPGESVPMTVTIENQEGGEVDYTVVVQEQTIEDGEIVERTELESLETSISDETTGTGELSVTPTAGDGEVRISVLLYEGEPPAEPTNENADEDTYVWVTIDE